MSRLQNYSSMVGNTIEYERDDTHEGKSSRSRDTPYFLGGMLCYEFDKNLGDNLKIISGFRNYVRFDNCPFFCIEEDECDVFPNGIDEESDHREGVLGSAVRESFEDVANFDIWRTIDIAYGTSNSKYSIVDTCR